MKRCLKCCMPDTRPDTHFVDGVCSACLAYEARPRIDWAEREARLMDLLEHARNDSGFDCIVPSSGGKDSHYQVLELVGRGFRPLVVTATTCHLTAIGRANIDNLAKYASTVEITPNRTVRRKLNRIGLEMVGDISWPEHVSIFTTPFRAAVAFGIPLIIYGENPQNQYGGPPGSDEARTMTRRWVSEFGGFLGLRPSDLVMQVGGRAMEDYMPPTDDELSKIGVEAHFLGQYIPWDSHRNAVIAKQNGMKQEKPCEANWWTFENLDNAQTGLHDWFMFRKYGYGRGCAQISVDVRAGTISRDMALDWVLKHDGKFPYRYTDVWAHEITASLGITDAHLHTLAERFTNHNIMDELTRERYECLSRTE